jgi:HSP20 family molecular chaperone IbpA
MDVSETERQLQITAELPGIDAKDIEVLLADDRLTIRGETKADHEEKERSYHVMECSRGSFSHSLRLPFAADPNQVKAAFKDGALADHRDLTLRRTEPPPLHARLSYAVGRDCSRALLNRSMIPRLNAGMSSGLRLDTRLPSVTTG